MRKGKKGLSEVVLLNKKRLYDELSAITEIDRAMSDLLYNFFTKKVMDLVMDGKVVQLDGFGYFHLMCMASKFEMKHHYYGHVKSDAMFIPAFKASTVTIMKFMKVLGGENIGDGIDKMMRYRDLLRMVQQYELDKVVDIYAGTKKTSNRVENLERLIENNRRNHERLKKELKSAKYELEHGKQNPAWQ